MAGPVREKFVKNQNSTIDYRFPSLTKGDTVFHAIRRAILLREVDAGQPLTEQQIGKEFNCSQGTVREALMRLQGEGLVQRRGYRGTTVCRSSLAEAAQMAEIRIKLEVEGISRAVNLFKEQDFTEIEEYPAKMEQVAQTGDSYALSELDRTFHLVIFRRSGLLALEPILKRCMLHMHLQTFGNPEADREGFSPTQAHQPIIDALRARDPERAAMAMKEHISAIISLGSPSLKSALDANAHDEYQRPRA